MTEEQVKQVVVDMISSGELEIRLTSTHDPFLKKTQTSLTIFHQKADGYRKQILKRSTM